MRFQTVIKSVEVGGLAGWALQKMYWPMTVTAREEWCCDEEAKWARALITSETMATCFQVTESVLMEEKDGEVVVTRQLYFVSVAHNIIPQAVLDMMVLQYRADQEKLDRVIMFLVDNFDSEDADDDVD